MAEKNTHYRLPLMILAVFSLTAAVWAGLVRLGWAWPALQPQLPINHGPLMVAGFFGTLISLERAVAKGEDWTYLGPLLSGIGSVFLALGVLGSVGPVLITLGSLWLVVIFIAVLRDGINNYTLVMALGALALLVGNLLWLFGWPVYMVVWWWAGFLILTIAGERLELGRLVKLSKLSQILFALAVAVFLAGMVVASFSFDLGVRIISAGVFMLGLWLLRYDIARRTVKMTGLTRFVAVCLLSGYVWLLVSGVIGFVYGGIPAGPIYGAMLHAVFLGFVFAMIFGHAPIIFPAVLGLDIQYGGYFYLALVSLHLSLILRIGGDLVGWGWARLWGGMFNFLAVLLYIGMISPLAGSIKTYFYEKKRRKSMNTVKPFCIHCERDNTQVPLIALDYQDNKAWICPEHMPILIHKPHQLVGKLGGAEELSAVDAG